MENNIQDVVDQQNKQNQIEHKKQKLLGPFDRLFDRINATREKRKAKLDARKQQKAEKLEKKAEEERKRAEFEDACNEKYQTYLEMSNNPDLNNKIIKGENGELTHVVQREYGYVLSTRHRLIDARAYHDESHTLEGFARMRVNGVKQIVYVNITKTTYTHASGPDSDKYYEYGYCGCIRTPSGAFKRVRCTADEDNYAINQGDVSFKAVLAVFSDIEKSYYHQSVSSNQIF